MTSSNQARRLVDGATHLYQESQDIAERALKNSKELYDKTVRSLPEGSSRVIGIASAGLAIGVLGYVLGRSQRKNATVRMTHSANTLARKAPKAVETISRDASRIDFEPAFKFLKLWMLYRVAI